MCGHVGVAGTITRDGVDAFCDLLHFDTRRGPHSTGVLAVGRGKDPDCDVVKMAVPALYLMETKLFDQKVTTGKSVLLGHNRFATVGKINRANAHPFEFEHVIGAHNGTIAYSDRDCIIGGDKFDTDSEGIFNMINELGVEQTIPELYGAWALVWYDKRDHSINFIRNSERELYYVLAEDGKSLWWASEAGMLHAALRRRGIAYETAWMLPENSYHKWIVPLTFNGQFNEEPDQRMQLEGRKEPKRTYYHSQARFPQGPVGVHHAMRNGSPAMGQGAPPFGTPRTNTPDASTTKTSGSNSNSKPTGSQSDKKDGEGEADKNWAHPLFRTVGKKSRKRTSAFLTCFDGEVMDENNFKKRTKETCAACDATVPWESIIQEEEKVKFINREQFFCEECGDDPWALGWFEQEKEERTSAYH